MTPSVADKDLAKLLLDGALIAQPELKAAQDLASEKKISLYDALLGKDLITDENLGKLIADNLQVPFVNLQKEVILGEVLRMIPEEVAERQLAIVFGKDES